MRLKGKAMIRATVLCALVLTVAFAAVLTPIPCLGQDSKRLPPNLPAKATKKLPPDLLALLQQKKMPIHSPILVRVFKEEAELEVWKQDSTGRFQILKTYPICRWSGELGPKFKEGDRQAPEGFYAITPGQMNPNSAYYLSFDLGYPNAYDRSWGRTGAQLMVHGDCSSRGCYSMTDEQILEIYALGRDAFFGGQKSFQVQALPFHMNARNMARHRNNPNLAFWKMLKKGTDHFEVTGLEPKVNVCERHYVFDAASPDGRQLTFSASGKCPVYRVPDEIASLVQDKEAKDEQEFADLSRRNIATAPVRTGADGGMNQVFMDAVKKNQIGVPPQEAMFVSTPPGTIPTHVRPPKVAELADAPVVVADGQAAPAADASSKTLAIAATPAPSRSSGGGLFGSLFGSKSSSETPPPEKTEGTLDRMKRMVGLGNKDKPDDAAAPSPAAAAKTKPAAKPASQVASHGAIKSKSAEAQPANNTEAQPPAATPAAVAWPAAQPVATPASNATTGNASPGASASSATQKTGTAMNGSAPVVPTGNFDNRWSGFR